MITKEQAQEMLNSIPGSNKIALYNKGLVVFYDSKTKSPPWIIQSWGDCFAFEVARYDTYEDMLNAIPSLPNYPDLETRVW